MKQDEIKTIQVEPLQTVRGLTMTGMSIMGTRQYQQDTYYMISTRRGSLAVICDGMGGMECGEVASKVAVEKLVGDFETWEDEESPTAFLQKEAGRMDQAVASIADAQGDRLDTGTTVVSVIIQDNSLYWLSVGDSRIYVLRGEEMLCVTQDHNYELRLRKWLQTGEITQEEYDQKSDQKEALISYLGMDGLELVDSNVRPLILLSGDRILLCSDGLYKCLPEEKIKNLLMNRDSEVKDIVEDLLHAVEEEPRKNKDNTTVILLEYR